MSICGFISFCLLAFVICFFPQTEIFKVSAEENNIEKRIEKALFTRQEFFGAEAVVPFPTAQARENLAELQKEFPDNAEILRKLADADEKLSDYDSAEKHLIRFSELAPENLESLAAFYNRRARFEKEAEITEKMLADAKPEYKAAFFSRLMEAARRHDLKKYLQPVFYEKIARENPSVYPIFERLIDELIKEGNQTEALNTLRQAKAQFPERLDVLRDKEISILLEMKKPKEAEEVYRAAFDPFWSSAETENYYGFLSRQDRLRAYGAELKTKFKSNPADFDTAIRLAHYRKYNSDAVMPTIHKLEENKSDWTAEELLTTARFLISENEGDMASRFLYTLYARNDLQANEQLRAKVLYQLFEIFSDAEQQRLSLVKGDLRFYEDVAKADSSPGITTGLLSLIFSDTNPQAELAEKESIANGLFNRAAAYRIFLAYKEENPNSTELAQMYLDIVRLYTAAKKPEIAAKTLTEFEQRYENAADYPNVAIKLADAYVAVNETSKEREIYQKVLDYLGKNQKPKRERESYDDNYFSNYPATDTSVTAPNRNDGINIPTTQTKPNDNDYYADKTNNIFHDYTDREKGEIYYADVLERYVSSLAEEKQTARILELYSNEIAKYPDEQWLYDERLNWLEQTNLHEEQLQIYRQALNRFQTGEWRDKLARWFLRRNRQAEFAEYSQDIIAKLNDAETSDYLVRFVDAKISASEFDRELYLKLYRTAHERFPHNLAFVNALLKFYKENKRENEWRALAAAYYFQSREVRGQFLDDLAKTGELRRLAADAETKDSSIYKLFRADAAVRLSNYEAAVPAYRELNRLYPNTPEFAGRLTSFTRSFGQKSRDSLNEAADVAHAQTEFAPSSAESLTLAGEIRAELGDYEGAKAEWEKLIATAEGTREIYLDAATVYWDYFQYREALQTIVKLREKTNDETLYAFEAGAILEAQHKKAEAVGEYVKALDAKRDEEQKEKAQKRLARLVANEANRKAAENASDLTRTIDSAFTFECSRRGDDSFLVLAYAEFLSETGRGDKANKLLEPAIFKSDSSEFLESVRDFYSSYEDPQGKQIALRRLGEIETSPRRQIAFRLQHAESLRESGNRDSAKSVLNELVRKFPTNYGVLTETADFYWRFGFDAEAVNVLQSGVARGRGDYRKIFAGKLATRFIQLNRFDSAERTLAKLHEEDKADAEIFNQLAVVYVRSGDAASLRRTFNETVRALRQTDADRRELDSQIADLRMRMIDAFTKLKDYKSAVEQHIEIINREPDDETVTENAIRYVQRYGGAETLLDYYRKTSFEAFKNYRWNVVLARIYAANNDLENAAVNYHRAIVNQPEMVELYAALVEIETKRNNYDEALKNLDVILKLTGGALEYTKKKIEILRKAQRIEEAEIEQAKLPVEAKPKGIDRFAEARKLQNTEKEKARQLYREAFVNLLEKPLTGEMKAADIAGYVVSVREEESLDQITARLWQLRGKLVETADDSDSIDAGEARKRLSILDHSLIEAVGNIAVNYGTDDERAALHADLNRRIDDNYARSDAQQTISLVQNLSRRAGFGDLEEKILRKRLDGASLTSDRQIYLRDLVKFYYERGAYGKVYEVTEQYESENLPLKAETARLVNNREKELEALRAIYWKAGEITTAPNADAARYLEILYADNHSELKSLTEKSSVYQLQLINFLLGKNEREMAHAAIENAKFSASWKVSRHAETSLALKEFGADAECYFCVALQFQTIGEFVKQTPDKKEFLVNDEWFRLSREYGEWLGEKAKTQASADENMRTEADRYLTALTENRPNDASEQSKLGEFYLERTEPEKAIEHFRLAMEIQSSVTGDKATLANLGAAYYLAGKKDAAEELWAQVLADEEITGGAIYFQVLSKYGLAEKARNNLPPIITGFLQTNDADQSEAFQNLIRAVAASFQTETEKAAYFLKITDERRADTSLAEMLVNENLIDKSQRNAFYELLIRRGDGLRGFDSDYDYAPVLQRVWTADEAESVFDQENNYKTEEPNNERFNWRKKYLETLFEQRETVKAKRIVGEIEKELNGHYARPEWLRLAEMRLRIRSGNFDFAEAEKFVGIRVPDSVSEIKPPSVERLNAVLDLLKEENLEVESNLISEAFYARALALEQYETANFAGLARAFFRNGKAEKAVRILQLTVDANNEEKREIALAELAAIEEIKAQTADASKITKNETNNLFNRAEALKIGAEIALGYGQIDAAISFRQQLVSLNPDDAPNKIELAVIYTANNRNEEATNFLTQIVNDRNALRAARWQAIWELKKSDGNTQIKNTNFDAFSQFYNGLHAKNNQATETAVEFFINCLIADLNAEAHAKQKLIELYALSGKPYAALKLAETDKAQKSDELLQMLSEAAEKTKDYVKALEYEKAKSGGASRERINRLQQMQNQKNYRATDFTVDLQNTRKL